MKEREKKDLTTENFEELQLSTDRLGSLSVPDLPKWARSHVPIMRLIHFAICFSDCLLQETL